MRLRVPKEQLLKPMQQVIGVVERRQTLAILGHVLLVADDEGLTITATDLEVELKARQALEVEQHGRITLPARKLLDIVKSLPEGTTVDLSVKDSQAVLRCGSARFTLALLPDEDFPALDEIEFESEFHTTQGLLRDLLNRTHFAMAQQDVRYYLNGLYIVTEGPSIIAVATDGHRLALSETLGPQEQSAENHVIVPRKGVHELLRLFEVPDADVLLQMGTNHIRVLGENFRFTSRLIDGRFPDYRRVIPAEATNPLLLDRQQFRDALSRTAILSNEKYRGVRLRATIGSLELLAHNPENEEAEERLEVDYDGPDLEVGFNVTYLLDALGAIQSESVKLFLFDANSSCLIRASDSEDCRYVVMPMRL